jgi:hypothetical protein
MGDLGMKMAKVTADVKTAAAAPVCDGMPSVYVRFFQVHAVLRGDQQRRALCQRG